MPKHLDAELWKYGMTVIAILITVLIVSAAVVASIYFRSAPQQAALASNELLKNQSATRLLTVLVVVSAACVLSLFHVLNDGAIAILSGITGYVLGGLPATNGPDVDKEIKTEATSKSETSLPKDLNPSPNKVTK